MDVFYKEREFEEVDNKIKEEVKKHIYELADEKYKEFHSGLCPETKNIVGVRTPVLRAYAKKLNHQYEIEELLESIDNELYEEIMLQGMLIGLIKDIDKVFKYTRKFIPKIDNWAVCDIFCASLKITKKYKKEMWEFIQEYTKSDKEFEIRFSIVMLLDYYIDKEYLAKDFQIFNQIANDGYYVKMAVAWAISICLIKYYDETIEYLKTAKLDNWTYNKALQKARESYRISDEKKKKLRDMKKNA